MTPSRLTTLCEFFEEELERDLTQGEELEIKEWAEEFIRYRQLLNKPKEKDRLDEE